MSSNEDLVSLAVEGATRPLSPASFVSVTERLAHLLIAQPEARLEFIQPPDERARPLALHDVHHEPDRGVISLVLV